MAKYTLLFLLIFPILSFGQNKIELKRKYLGSYEGIIPGYSIESSQDIMNVAATDIVITIGKNQVEITVGGNALFGTFTVMFEAKSYYLLDVVVDGQLANERILVYKRGRHLSRDGMYPQPVTELTKIKKKKKS